MQLPGQVSAATVCSLCMQCACVGNGSAAHFFFCFALRSSRPSGFVYCTRSPIFPFMRPHKESGSPLGSAASLVRVSAVSTRLEFCSAQKHHQKQDLLQSSCQAGLMLQDYFGDWRRHPPISIAPTSPFDVSPGSRPQCSHADRMRCLTFTQLYAHRCLLFFTVRHHHHSAKLLCRARMERDWCEGRQTLTAL